MSAIVGASTACGPGCDDLPVTTRHVLVFGDSLTFHGPQGPVAVRDPRLYPNVLADQLSATGSGGAGEVRVDVVARLGWTARDAWWALTKDPVVASVLAPRADALVLAVGQMDQLPAAVPTYLRDGIPYVRPGSLRRRLRRVYRRAGPVVIRASGGRLRQLPQPATDTYLDRLLAAVRLLAPSGPALPVVLLGPSPWRSAAYPSGRSHGPAVTAARRWAVRSGVPMVELDPLVGPSLADGSGNPDGLHWSWEAHRLVGLAAADALNARGSTGPVR
jgi:diglucosylglycerate octanoyltransferase